MGHMWRLVTTIVYASGDLLRIDSIVVWGWFYFLFFIIWYSAHLNRIGFAKVGDLKFIVKLILYWPNTCII